MPAERLTESQLQAAIAKNTHKIKVRQRAIQLLRTWRAVRQRQLRKVREARGPAGAAKYALSLVGRHEDTGRPNHAAWLDKWALYIGQWMLGQPWCGLTVYMICRHVGIRLDPRTVSTVYIRAAAQQGTGGFKTWHPPTATPQVGWVPVYGTPASGPQHTGFCVEGGPNAKFVEGNTSPGTGGSQNNGGGIYIRTLAERRSWLLGYAEPDWSKA